MGGLAAQPPVKLNENRSTFGAQPTVSLKNFPPPAPGSVYLHTQLIDMKICIGLLFLLAGSLSLHAQPATIQQIKAELEKSPNPVLYTKQILKKRFKIDTIIVSKTRNFSGIADSLAYTGKEKKVYGPYGPKGQQFLVQLLSKAPNQFYHIAQIFIDTSVFRYHTADSLGNMIIQKIRNGTATFEQLALTYSMGGEAATKGDLGWIARGAMLPTIEHEVIVHKKGEVFRIWSRKGLHIIKKIDDPRQDTGFALMMQVFL
jgi:hypothetical protein